MGTRGFMGVVVDGREKLTYNHFDSYPTGLGIAFLKDLMGLTDQPAKFAEQARNLRLVKSEAKPTAADFARLSQHADPYVGGNMDHRQDGSVFEYYQLLRGVQGDLAATLEAGVMIDSHLFPYDSLFAEWGYVADLDAGTFEVYRGFQTRVPTEGRWATPTRRGVWKRMQKTDYGYRSNPYHAVQRVAVWPLDALPSQAELEALEAEVYAADEARYAAENA